MNNSVLNKDQKQWVSCKVNCLCSDFSSLLLLLPLQWVHSLDLKSNDRIVIQKNGLLNDKHMHAVHKLLRKQFPHINGLQSTLLSQKCGFSSVSSDGKYQCVVIDYKILNYSCLLLSHPDSFHWR